MIEEPSLVNSCWLFTNFKSQLRDKKYSSKKSVKKPRFFEDFWAVCQASILLFDLLANMKRCKFKHLFFKSFLASLRFKILQSLKKMHAVHMGTRREITTLPTLEALWECLKPTRTSKTLPDPGTSSLRADKKIFYRRICTTRLHYAVANKRVKFALSNGIHHWC